MPAQGVQKNIVPSQVKPKIDGKENKNQLRDALQGLLGKGQNKEKNSADRPNDNKGPFQKPAPKQENVVQHNQGQIKVPPVNLVQKNTTVAEEKKAIPQSDQIKNNPVVGKEVSMPTKEYAKISPHDDVVISKQSVISSVVAEKKKEDIPVPKPEQKIPEKKQEVPEDVLKKILNIDNEK